jgi:hypothetical protein
LDDDSEPERDFVLESLCQPAACLSTFEQRRSSQNYLLSAIAKEMRLAAVWAFSMASW